MAHPGPCPGSRLQHIQPLLPLLGQNGSHRKEGLGRREWRREQRRWISQGRRQGRQGERRRIRRPRKREGARERKSLPRPLLRALLPGSRSPVPEGVYTPEVPTPGPPHSAGQSEGWRDAEQTRWFHVCAGPWPAVCHLPSHHFRHQPHLHNPGSPKGQRPHQVDLGLSKWADQSLCVDVETEAREGKKLVQDHAGSSCQRSRMRPPLFGDSKRGERANRAG